VTAGHSVVCTGHCVLYCTYNQTWSSRDLSLGLETSQDPFLQVLVSVLVLEPQSLGLGLGTLESWSRSWSWNLRVLVLVLEPSSLGLGLGLGTWDHEDSVFVTRIMKREILLPLVTSAPVERIISHSGLLMRANRARMGDNMLSQLVYLL